jgi:type I restriction enzyme, R subunit
MKPWKRHSPRRTWAVSLDMHPYHESHIVEHPAMLLFEEMAWQVELALDETFGADGKFGRETPSDVVLPGRLAAALQKLNPSTLPETITLAIDELTRDRSAMSLAAANRDVYTLIKDGIRVSVPDHQRGGQKEERLRVIDWQNATANDFLFVGQLTVTGTLYTRRPDLVGFVNGLPLIVIELKKPGVPAQQAFDDNLTCYKADIPQLFWYNALMIASNGTDSRVGSLTADWDRCFEWKRIEREDEPRRVSLEVMIRGVCEPSRLLDLVENFTLFSEHKAGLAKILGQNHQFLGVNNAIAAAMKARELGHGRGGVYWQTQGSGKSLAMVFFAQKILRKVPGNWTFIIITDRVELDDQIAKTFKACGAVSEADAQACHATSGDHLRQLLSENHRYVFTLIHKFQSTDLLCDRKDVIVLTDEAHRSQYDTLALNMRAALPKALFLAFTGTPLIVGEERTREVFGDYVSIYDFQQSVDDHATVPLYYENRTPELHLDNPDLNDDLYNLIEEAGLDEEQEKRLERELGRQYHLITRDERLDTISNDIVNHFLGRGFQGKAMVVSIDKATALRMYDKVQQHWQAERQRVEAELAKATRPGIIPDADQVRELKHGLEILNTTDMALIVSSGQNEIAQMQAFGLDIAPHRRRMNEQPLDEYFKDPAHPLRLVFLCAMWLTGFDAPSCSTVYLDKPMRNHTLMQTIARANRVYPGKHSGLIVDYANVFASLERALAIYGAGRGAATPVRNKAQLVADLKTSVEAARAFCQTHGVDITRIDKAPAGTFERVKLIADAVEKLITPDPLRKEFLGHVRLVRTLFQAVKPDPAALQFLSIASCLTMIADAIAERTGEGRADIAGVMLDVTKLLDDSIAADGFTIRHTNDKAVVDLSKIDFEALAKRFAQSKTKNIELEQLKAAIRRQLERMITVNRTRADYLSKFEELIEQYNNGSRNIEELLSELLTLSRALDDEEQRHVRENLTEEELVIFDILTRPGPDLTTEEGNEIKKVARELLQKVKTLLVINWRQKNTARSQVKLAIEDMLDVGLPRAYSPDLYKQKCAVVFKHVYENYPELPRGQAPQL